MRVIRWLILAIFTTVVAAPCPSGTSLVSLYAANHDALRCIRLKHCMGTCAAPWVQDYNTCICIPMLPCLRASAARTEHFNGDSWDVRC